MVALEVRGYSIHWITAILQGTAIFSWKDMGFPDVFFLSLSLMRLPALPSVDIQNALSAERILQETLL